MPSLRHELLVSLFRNRAELARELLALIGRPQPSDGTAETLSPDLTQVTSAEYRADHITVLRDAAGAARLVVIVEVQLSRDAAKRSTWPVYIAVARDREACPTVLLVLAPDPDVAAWARKPIELGHPGFCLEPLVISYLDVPPRIDLLQAERVPELALLCALAHPSLARAEQAMAVIRDLSHDQSRLYLDVILAALDDDDRRTLEDLMLQGYQYQSEFAKRYYGQGKEEGKAEGLAEGKSAGLAEGKSAGLAGLQLAALELARTKLGSLDRAGEAAISALDDVTTLTSLVIALGAAVDRDHARVVFEQAIR